MDADDNGQASLRAACTSLRLLSQGCSNSEISEILSDASEAFGKASRRLPVLVAPAPGLQAGA